ncbi:MAG: VOC family protein [Acidobacteria bacterium]|nr:VOC family protein [Acidobacteriota bacterium]
MNDQPNVKQAVPFFWVTDMEASVRFYVEGLGFQITRQWVDDGKLRWCWLEIGDAALMLQEFWKEGHHANVPTEKLGVGVSICFICEDALAIYRQAKSNRLEASKPFVGNGMWVTALIDPDGHRIDFESHTDVPEETEFEE